MDSLLYYLVLWEKDTNESILRAGTEGGGATIIFGFRAPNRTLTRNIPQQGARVHVELREGRRLVATELSTR